MKAPGIWHQLKAILVLPFMVLIVVPSILYYYFETGLPTSYVARIISGLLFLFLGCYLLIKSIVLFIKIGKGTLAPWQPTQKLVVKSLYQYTRNPMILGVLSILFSEALLLNSLAILIWMLLFFLINTIYFIKKEEPDLEKRFGKEYLVYKRNVPRWFPRSTPWKPE